MKRQCSSCERLLPLEDFYPDPRMKSGYRNECRECRKAMSRAHYDANRPHRLTYALRQREDPAWPARNRENVKRYRLRHPDWARARGAVSRALRSGRLVRTPCEVCGALEVQAHHDDYSRPLAVRWLCYRCRRGRPRGRTSTGTVG